MSIVLGRMCRLCHVVICKRKFYENFLVIGTHRFDRILKIDWLNTSHAVISCRKRSIIFRIPNHLESVFFRGSKLVELPEL